MISTRPPWIASTELPTALRSKLPSASTPMVRRSAIFWHCSSTTSSEAMEAPAASPPRMTTMSQTGVRMTP